MRDLENQYKSNQYLLRIGIIKNFIVKIIIFVIILIASIMQFNCSSLKKKKMDRPQWYLSPPNNDDAIYESGCGVKRSMGLATEIADKKAKEAIIRNIEVKISSMFNGAMQINAEDKEFKVLEYKTSVSKKVLNNVMEDCEITERVIRSGGDFFYVYSLAKYNIDDLVQQILKAIIADKEIYGKIKSDVSFSELENNIKLHFKRK